MQLRHFSILIVLIFSPAGAFAQARTQEKPKPAPSLIMRDDYMARPYYDALVNEALKGPSENFNYGFLRGRYAMIDSYDPIGDDTRGKLLDQAYIIQTSKDSAAVRKAQEAYKALIRDHLGNISVVAQAAALAREDRRFGDPKLFSRIQNGLFQDVLYSGDGKTLRGAYDVVVMAEETMLLRHLNVEVLHTDARESGGIYYNMHSVVDPGTDTPYTIFVNVTIPMDFLEQQRRETARPFTLRRQ